MAGWVASCIALRRSVLAWRGGERRKRFAGGEPNNGRESSSTRLSSFDPFSPQFAAQAPGKNKLTPIFVDAQLA
jgi:hypothetical protein